MTGEQELERLANEHAAMTTFVGPQCEKKHWVHPDRKESFLAGYKAHQSEAELLRKRIEKLRAMLKESCFCLEGYICDVCEALSDDKASEGGV